MTTDTSEKGLEVLICERLTDGTVVEIDADGEVVGGRAAAVDAVVGAGLKPARLETRLPGWASP